MSEPEWRALYILPNISLDEPIGCSAMAIIPPSDPRFTAMAHSDPGLAPYVARFTDVMGEPVEPAILVHRKDIPESYLTAEAVAAFRDSIAIAAICTARSHHVSTGDTRGALFCESFAFYPWMLQTDQPLLAALSPSRAVLGLGVDRIYPQAHPALHRARLRRSQVDPPLLTALLGAWTRRFSRSHSAHVASMQKLRRSERVRISLFRSLNMASQACSHDDLRDEHIFDQGRSIMNWISAFEILIHPKCDFANKDAVVAHLLATTRKPEIYTQKYSFPARGKGKPKEMTVTEWLYTNLNSLRNDFAHGNPIDQRSMWIDDRPDHRLAFLHLAPALYRAALATTLEMDIRAKATDDQTDEELAARIAESLSRDHAHAVGDAALQHVIKHVISKEITAQ